MSDSWKSFSKRKLACSGQFKNIIGKFLQTVFVEIYCEVMCKSARSDERLLYMSLCEFPFHYDSGLEEYQAGFNQSEDNFLSVWGKFYKELIVPFLR